MNPIITFGVFVTLATTALGALFYGVLQIVDTVNLNKKEQTFSPIKREHREIFKPLI